MKKIMFNDRYGLTQAVLNGSKTMTRRIVYDGTMQYEHRIGNDKGHLVLLDGLCRIAKSTYKNKETVAVAMSYHDIYEEMLNGDGITNEIYNSFITVGPDCDDAGYYNKMFVWSGLMPHRLTFTAIKLERLQDISDEDCLAEGIIFDNKHFQEWQGQYGFYDFKKQRPCLFKSPREAFANLIDKISGKGTWSRNPWVEADRFRLIA